MKKFLTFGLTLLAGISLLSACGSKENSSENQNSNSNNEENTSQSSSEEHEVIRFVDSIHSKEKRIWYNVTEVDKDTVPDPIVVTGNEEIFCYSYNQLPEGESKNWTLGELSKLTDEEILERLSKLDNKEVSSGEITEYNLTPKDFEVSFETDSSGNNIVEETVKAGKSKRSFPVRNEEGEISSYNESEEFSYFRINGNMTINMPIYDAMYGGFSIDSDDPLLITRIDGSEWFDFDSQDEATEGE